MIKSILMVLTAAFTISIVSASAYAASCPPGKRYYCQGSKCSCV